MKTSQKITFFFTSLMEIQKNLVRSDEGVWPERFENSEKTSAVIDGWPLK